MEYDVPARAGTHTPPPIERSSRWPPSRSRSPRMRRAEPNPLKIAVWRRAGRDETKLRRARSLAWDEFATGNRWLTYVGTNG